MTSLPWILWRYIGRSIAIRIGAITLIATSILYIFEVVELFRRTAHKADVSGQLILEMALFKVPAVVEHLFPMLIFFACFSCIKSLNEKMELVVMRSSGVSMMQIVAPIIGVVLAISALYITVYTPLSSVLQSKFETLDARLFKSQDQSFAVLKSGLWLQRFSPGGKERYVIHSKSISKRDHTLDNLTIYSFSADTHQFLQRIDASKAQIRSSDLLLTDAQTTLSTNPHASETEENLLSLPLVEPVKSVPIKLSLASLEQSVASPRAFSFFQLPKFIATLEDMGFSALPHKLHWYRLLTLPLVLCAMVFWAAYFGLPWQRHQSRLKALGVPCTSVFGLYIVSEIFRNLGVTSTLTPGIATFLGAGVIFIVGFGLLMLLQER